MEIGDALQSLLYGQLTVDIQNPSHLEQLEIVRAVVANPSAIRRLKIVGDVHPWVQELLKTVGASGQTHCEPKVPEPEPEPEVRPEPQGQTH